MTLICLSFHPQARALDDPLVISLEGGTVSMAARDVALGSILERFSEEHGFEYKGSPSSLEQKVTMRFEGLSPAAALDRLLRGESYVSYFAEDGTLVGVLIFGEGGGTSLVPSMPRAAAGEVRPAGRRPAGRHLRGHIRRTPSADRAVSSPSDLWENID